MCRGHRFSWPGFRGAARGWSGITRCRARVRVLARVPRSRPRVRHVERRHSTGTGGRARAVAPYAPPRRVAASRCRSRRGGQRYSRAQREVSPTSRWLFAPVVAQNFLRRGAAQLAQARNRCGSAARCGNPRALRRAFPAFRRRGRGCGRPRRSADRARSPDLAGRAPRRSARARRARPHSWQEPRRHPSPSRRAVRSLVGETVSG